MKTDNKLNNKKFINNIWITGIFNNLEIIGRTCILNDEEMVTVVNENAIPQIIKFSEISNVGKLNIVDKTKNKNTPKIRIIDKFKQNIQTYLN